MYHAKKQLSEFEKPKFISVIVPSYRQEKTIVANVRQLHAALAQMPYEYELIVVIDGVVDSSYEVLKKARCPQTTVITYDKNRGKSAAIRIGMSKAKGQNILFIDAGMEIDPQGMHMLLLHLEWYQADIIVGSKRHVASIVKYNVIRRILSEGYYLFVKLLFGVTVKDTQAGIKVFRKEVLERILPRLLEKRFAGDLEMLVVAKQLGFKRIFEAPIKLDYELASLSSAVSWSAIYYIILDTLAIFYRSRILHSYDIDRKKIIEPPDLKVERL